MQIAYGQFWKYPWMQNSRQEHFWIVKHYNKISKIVKLVGFFDGYGHIMYIYESSLTSSGTYIKGP